MTVVAFGTTIQGMLNRLWLTDQVEGDVRPRRHRIERAVDQNGSAGVGTERVDGNA